MLLFPFRFFVLSVKKVKSKEAQKEKRKLFKQTFKDKQMIRDEILQKKEESGTQSQQKGTNSYIATTLHGVFSS